MNVRLGWLVCLLFSYSSYAHAENWFTEGDNFSVQLGFYTHHFNSSPEHVNHNHMVALEYQTPARLDFGKNFGVDKNLIGFSIFKNSFGQSSQYAYGGWWFDLRALL